MAVQIGSIAPDFTLYNTQKQPVTLSSLRGKAVVLLFFPMAFSGVCTEELCAVREDMDSYDSLDTTVLGISVDSVYSLAKFKKDLGVNFEFLSDFNKTVSRAYDAIYEQFGYGMLGVSKRAAFVIDNDGIVRHANVLENAGLIPDFDEIKAVLKEMK